MIKTIFSRNLKFILVVYLFFFVSCNEQRTEETGSNNSTPKTGGTFNIGILQDLDYLNPVITSNITSEAIQDLIFPSLVDRTWDEKLGIMEFTPYYANSWKFSPNKKDLTYYLKNNIFWEDGQKVNPSDIFFTFKLISDPVVASPKQSNLSHFIKNKMNKADIGKSIEIENDTTLTFHFDKNYYAQISQTSIQFLPGNYFRDVNPKDMRNHPKNFKPVSSGPFKLDKWEENQYLVFSKNQNYSLSVKPNFEKIIIKVIPEYLTRLTALKNSEIDFMEGLSPEDVPSLKSNNPNIQILPLLGCNYEYISWSNIDNVYYLKTKKIRPHPLFGSNKVRRALTMAINRVEIIRGFLGEYGILCNGPISPVFKWAYNNDIKPYSYDLQGSKKILSEEGWKDDDNDGILEKDGKKFKFTLFINIGTPRREYIANIVKNNLKKVGIEVNIEKLEFTILGNKIFNREIDAFIFALQVSSEILLENSWSSDLEKARFNEPGFQNKRVDELIRAASNVNDIKESAPYLKEFQTIIHEEEPCTFLHWYSNIIGYNKRIKNVKSDIWNSYNHLWEWWAGN